jgi:hypothetical protein
MVKNKVLEVFVFKSPIVAFNHSAFAQNMLTLETANPIQNLGGNVLSWTHPVVVTAIVLFATTFPLFLWNEGRVPFPIMPLKLLSRDPQASIIIVGAFLATHLRLE